MLPPRMLPPATTYSDLRPGGVAATVQVSMQARTRLQGQNATVTAWRKDLFDAHQASCGQVPQRTPSLRRRHTRGTQRA